VASPPHSSRFEIANLPIKTLLQIAYGFDAPVVGAPDWVANTFYTIQARSDEAADARLAQLTTNEVRLEKRNAIRVLLAERLWAEDAHGNAQFRHLQPGGGQGRHQDAGCACASACRRGRGAASAAPTDIQAHGSQHGLEFNAKNSSMRAIAGVLSSMVEAPVMDKTGLTGIYNYTLQFGRDWSDHDPDSFPSILPRCRNSLDSSWKLSTSPCLTWWWIRLPSLRRIEEDREQGVGNRE